MVNPASLKMSHTISPAAILFREQNFTRIENMLHALMNGTGFSFSEYEMYIKDLGDQRVKEWMLMQSPMTVVLIVAVYLGFCNSWGPRFMKHRKPYELKTVLLVYNAVNVVLSAWLVHECLFGGWWSYYSYTCQIIDYTPRGSRMARMSYVYFLCKILELLDTVFFVLRKKDNQITFLHLYHHATMPICCWLGAKFVPGGHVTSGYLMNCMVHVVMYSYYLLAALGPSVQKHLWWKKYITAMQLVQFVMMVSHQCLLFVYDCEYPRFVSTLQIVQAAYFFYLFSSFYVRSYAKGKASRTSQHSKNHNNNLLAKGDDASMYTTKTKLS